MKTKLTALTLALLAFAGSVTLADPLGTAFTYHGKLDSNGQLANGHYDLQFTLYDALTLGSVQGGPLPTNAVPVSNGLFTVTLDFGTAVFKGDARWLDIAVKTNGAGAFTPLVPRQPLTPTPYALYAPSAGTAATASSLVGTLPDAHLSGNVPLRAGGNTFTGNQNISSGDLTLGSGGLSVAGNIIYNGQLSKLDVAEFLGPATVRSSDFLFGSASRRGTPGRAFVDLLTGPTPISNSTLVVNFQGDWAHLALDGNVGIQNWNSRFPLSLGGLSGNTKLAVWDDGANAMGFGVQPGQFRFHLAAPFDRFSFLDGPSGNELVTILGFWDYVGIGNPWPTERLDVGGNINYSGKLTKLDVADNFSAFVGAADFYLGHSSRRGSPGIALTDWGTNIWWEPGTTLGINPAGHWTNTLISGKTILEHLDVNGDGRMLSLDLKSPWSHLAFNAYWDQSVPAWRRIGAGFASVQQHHDDFGGLDWWVGGSGGAGEIADLTMAMRVAANGSVGLGTFVPGSQLDVNGGIRARGGPPGPWGTFNNGYAFGNPGDNDSGMFSLADGELEFFLNSNEMMRLKDGNVGIGTTNPAAKLDVNGNAQVSGYLVVDTQHSEGGSGLGLLFASGGGVIMSPPWPGTSMRGLSFWAAWEPQMSITPAGNVGIGTAEPAAKLDVAGTIKATALNVGGVPVVSIGSNLTINAQPVLSGHVQASQLATLGAPGPGQVLGYNGSSLVWQPAGGGSSVWSLNGSSTYYNSGSVGIGTATPQAKLDVNGSLQANDLFTPGDANVGNNLWVGNALQVGTFQAGSSADVVVYGSRVPPLYAPTRLIIKANGNVGIGTNNPQSRLEIDGQDALRMVGYEPFLTLVDNKNGGNAAAAIQNADGKLFFKPDAGHVQFQATDLWLGHPSRRGSPGRALVDGGTALHLNFNGDWANTVIGGGDVSVCSLTIRGGCDLAEPFPMKEENIGKGSVVVIDDEHPGQLMVSTQAYDTRVAGIISGANGINPGIALHQEGALDRGENVALTGRVYVKADASFGAIKPGDLLTTSETPGHAMKATDAAHAQGAILGKAMSGLKEGRGMVLVLVSLQ